MDASASQRFALISENLAEVMNPEILEKILAEGRHPKIYWGTDSPRRGQHGRARRAQTLTVC